MGSVAGPPDADDPDPITASYDVYIKPHLQDGRKLYILQFPNRESKHNYSAAYGMLPSEMRLKQKTGLFEMDVPIDPWHYYDRGKGVKWGEALKKTGVGRGSGGGASFGLPGGFGINAAPASRSRAAQEEGELSQGDPDLDFGNAMTEQRVLRKQTLGGQSVPKESATPEYMIGVFRQNQLHLTPIDQIIHMRPQFHHIDAQADVERSNRPRETTQASGAGPRAIHMTVKATVDGEEETTDTMAERIRAAQDEPWKTIKYVDEDSLDAWEVYETNLFVDTVDRAPKLINNLRNNGYLDAISAPRDAARLSRSKNVRGQEADGEDDDQLEVVDGDEEMAGT